MVSKRTEEYHEQNCVEYYSTPIRNDLDNEIIEEATKFDESKIEDNSHITEGGESSTSITSTDDQRHYPGELGYFQNICPFINYLLLLSVYMPCCIPSNKAYYSLTPTMAVFNMKNFGIKNDLSFFLFK